MSKQSVPVIFGVLALISVAPAVFAAEPTPIATHGQWSAYVVEEGAAKVCYMYSEPAEDKGNYTRRGQINALITNRPAEGTKNVFSYIAGYPYKPGSDVSVKIGNESFTLFTQDDTAWAPDAATDDKITAAMRQGSTMVVKGTSSRGTDTVDTFDLKGSGAAHDAITKECAAQ